MKILITTDWYAPAVNGVVTSVLNLENELAEKGHDVRILTLSNTKESYLDGNVYYINSFDIGKIYPQARATIHYHDKYVREIIEWSPDIIHSQCELVSFPFAKRIARKCKCPLVHTYHTVYEDYTHYFTKYDRAGKKFVALGTKFLLNSVNAVIAPTDKVKYILQGYGVGKYIETVPTGIDLKKFNNRLNKNEIETMKSELGLDTDTQVLVTIGRLAKEKNVQELIEHVNEMKEINSRIRLLIVGDGPYKEQLVQQVRVLKLEQYVLFTGMVKPEEVYKYYQLGDIFVCASQSETQGLTYIEALASGLPAVCKADQCIKEVIADGKNGYKYKSKQEFSKRVNNILDDDVFYQKLSENARLSAERYSTWAFADKIENIYRSEIYLGRTTYVHKLGSLLKRAVS